ncbi:uncharacterized protein LOC18438559 isoform X1 [Amborella trichopoda]|uniref:BZIP domain-containing protein n=1 Tax=Amborella trichopoda TaxID=13333 RepID=W1PRP2_AMBTC|nr:uncharacterized protein LOC18438559 isoform X1 [Amborella trichopoda]ERN10386.1 hypothetical protein AMTR_s00026p00134280 [Amborella trichopoda]|eukprot:XP_020525757.1 uncharacterized protein LOC18438559 isoform X1 [Amborella trichopoda]
MATDPWVALHLERDDLVADFLVRMSQGDAQEPLSPNQGVPPPPPPPPRPRLPPRPYFELPLTDSCRSWGVKRRRSGIEETGNLTHGMGRSGIEETGNLTHGVGRSGHGAGNLTNIKDGGVVQKLEETGNITHGVGRSGHVAGNLTNAKDGGVVKKPSSPLSPLFWGAAADCAAADCGNGNWSDSSTHRSAVLSVKVPVDAGPSNGKPPIKRPSKKKTSDELNEEVSALLRKKMELEKSVEDLRNQRKCLSEENISLKKKLKIETSDRVPFLDLNVPLTDLE